MSEVSAQGRRAMELARAGDLPGAVSAGEAALEATPDDLGLRMFVGVLCCRAGMLDRGIEHLKRAQMLAPADPVVRMELARASLSAGRLDEAEAATAGDHDPATPRGREFLRLAAHVAAARGRHQDALGSYTRLTQADGRDFESWQGLGLAHFASADMERAAEALTRAVALNPQLFPAQLMLGRALGALDRNDEAARALAAADALQPDSAEVLVEIGRIAVKRWNFEEAEHVLRRARALRPADGPAVAWLGDMLERTNRLDDLAALIEDAERDDVGEATLALLRARLLRRQGRLDEALAAAEASPLQDDPLQAQTVGEIADRLNDVPKAFAAFERLNRLLLAADPGADHRARGYRATIGNLRALTTRDWYAGWSPIHVEDGRRDPVFLYGFPRSGTTLLDTMLMGHPDTVVLEEEPAMQNVANRMGAVERLPRLTEDEIRDLRAHYWREVDAIAPEAPGRLVVDKFPLGLVGTAFAHRLFPNARFIFAERHPCDCVLSCFITRFRLNEAMSNFLRLEDAARLYDLALSYWAQCTSVFPIAVRQVRYERMVEDAEAELRPLAGFLGLPWDSRLVDHRSSAAARAFISSPSYSQVTEPLYRRASGRWRRYADQMAPVLPILAPWAERLGYEM